MARINLLNWREEMRQEKKKEFLTQLVGVCILAALIAFVWVRSVDSAIEAQNTRNGLLQSEINVLEKKVKELEKLKKERKELIDRMEVISDLEGKRSYIVRYFDEFSKAIPDGVFITTMEKRGSTITIEGQSESNNRISEFMRMIEDSDWFSDTSIISITADRTSGPEGQKFRLRFLAGEPNAEAENNG